MRVRSPRIARQRGTKGRPISPRRASQATAQDYERGIQGVRHDRDMNGKFRRRRIDDVPGDSRCRESRPAYGDRVGLRKPRDCARRTRPGPEARPSSDSLLAVPSAPAVTNVGPLAKEIA